jgi:hypothetical protein
MLKKDCRHARPRVDEFPEESLWTSTTIKQKVASTIPESRWECPVLQHKSNHLTNPAPDGIRFSPPKESGPASQIPSRTPQCRASQCGACKVLFKVFLLGEKSAKVVVQILQGVGCPRLEHDSKVRLLAHDRADGVLSRQVLHADEDVGVGVSERGDPVDKPVRAVCEDPHEVVKDDEIRSNLSFLLFHALQVLDIPSQGVLLVALDHSVVWQELEVVGELVWPPIMRG